MKKQVLLLVLTLFALAIPLRADDGGCDDSPEGPTIVLALAGFAGIAGFQAKNLLKRLK